MNDPIFSSLTGKTGTGAYCAGATCGAASEDSGLDGSWGFFCQVDVGLCTHTWNGNNWILTNNCADRCSCCKCEELQYPPQNPSVGQETYTNCIPVIN